MDTVIGQYVVLFLIYVPLASLPTFFVLSFGLFDGNSSKLEPSTSFACFSKP
jgi:hypothetical protein